MTPLRNDIHLQCVGYSYDARLIINLQIFHVVYLNTIAYLIKKNVEYF